MASNQPDRPASPVNHETPQPPVYELRRTLRNLSCILHAKKLDAFVGRVRAEHADPIPVDLNRGALELWALNRSAVPKR